MPNTLPRFATSLPLLPVKSVNPYAWAFDHPMGARDLSVATDVPRSSTAFLSYSLPFMRLRRSSRAVYQATAHESLMHPMSRASARPTASTLVISPLVWRNLLQNWRTLSLSQQQRTFSRLTAELSQQGIDRVVIDSSDSFFAPPVIKSQLVLEEPPHVLPPTLEPIINISVVPGAEANTYTINAATKLRYFEGFDVEAKKIAATKAIAKLAAKTIYDLKKSEHSDKSPGEFRAILAESSVSISDATNDAYAQAIVAECHALGLVQAQSEQSPPTFSATILMSSMSDCMADCERISRANLSHHKEWAPITVGPP